VGTGSIARTSGDVLEEQNSKNPDIFHRQHREYDILTRRNLAANSLIHPDHASEGH